MYLYMDRHKPPVTRAAPKKIELNQEAGKKGRKGFRAAVFLLLLLLGTIVFRNQNGMDALKKQIASLAGNVEEAMKSEKENEVVVETIGSNVTGSAVNPATPSAVSPAGIATEGAVVS